ncbi:MAG: radical SAM protein [Clostridiales bacterium]|nr:radical SAM protein [Clostridiales bacterium]
MYIASKFNVIKEKNGWKVIYNTMTQEIDQLSEEAERYLREGGEISSETLASLKEKGILIDSAADEDKVLSQLRKKYVSEPESLFLYLLPTEECNFRCKYCYEEFRHIWMSQETQDGIIEYVKTNISRYKFLRVEWFGGEPLLALNAIEYMSKKLIDICRQNHVLYYACMTTNAYTLDLHTFERLRKCKVLSYQITIDGPPAVHDNQRILKNGQGTFARIMENLIAIKDHVKTRMLDVTIRINVSRDMLRGIYGFIDDLYEKLLIDKRFNLLLKPVSNYGGDRVRDFEEQLCGIQDIQQAVDYCTEKGIISPEDDLSVGGNVCYASRNASWVIGADGSLYKCTVLLYDENNIVGRVRSNGVFEVDENKLSRWVCSGTDHGLGCDECQYAPICLKSVCYKRILCGQENGCHFVRESVDKRMDQYIKERRDNNNESSEY